MGVGPGGTTFPPPTIGLPFPFPERKGLVDMWEVVTFSPLPPTGKGTVAYMFTPTRPREGVRLL